MPSTRSWSESAEYFLVELYRKIERISRSLRDLKVLYYGECKPTHFDLQFTKYIPFLMNKLKSVMVAANEAYDWAIKAEEYV